MQLNIWKNLKYSLLILFTLTSIGSSQVTVESLEILSDKTIIVKISGIEYRGLPAPKLREILKDKAELDTLRTSYANIQAQTVELNKLIEEYKVTGDKILELEISKREKWITFWKTEYEKELRLRTKFQKEIESCSKFLFWRIC